MAFMFENLVIYQKAVDFTEQIVTLTQSILRGYYFLADQVNRAALSIATNLAEGNGRFTKADRRNFFIIARGSAQESVPLLELARRKGLLDELSHRSLRDQIDVIAKMISGLIAGIENRTGLSVGAPSLCAGD
jgi:four helix bundle protein